MKVGDKVKIVTANVKRYIGRTGTIISLNRNCRTVQARVAFDKHQGSDGFYLHKLELIKKKKPLISYWK